MKKKKAKVDSKIYKTMFDKVKNDPEYISSYNTEKALLEFAFALHDEREKLHMSQKDIAKKIGMKQQVVSRLENGVKDAKLSTLIKIASVFNKELVIGLKQAKGR